LRGLLDLERAFRPGRFTLLTAAGELSLVPLAYLVAWLWPRAGFPLLEWSWAAVGWGALAAVPPLCFLLWMLSGGKELRFARRIRDLLREFLGPTLAGLNLPQMALLALAAGIGEEVFFRGVLQPRLGLLPTALLFGLVHPFSVAHAALVALFGLYLGWLFQEAGSLLLPITAHALYDLVALCLLRRELRPPPSGARAEGAEEG
jgi:membrane protease YdiL (CAAX protease family)